jgi:hypothetical protein
MCSTERWLQIVKFFIVACPAAAASGNVEHRHRSRRRVVVVDRRVDLVARKHNAAPIVYRLFQKCFFVVYIVEMLFFGCSVWCWWWYVTWFFECEECILWLFCYLICERFLDSHPNHVRFLFQYKYLLIACKLSKKNNTKIVYHQIHLNTKILFQHSMISYYNLKKVILLIWH